MTTSAAVRGLELLEVLALDRAQANELVDDPVMRSALDRIRQVDPDLAATLSAVIARTMTGDGPADHRWAGFLADALPEPHASRVLWAACAGPRLPAGWTKGYALVLAGQLDRDGREDDARERLAGALHSLDLGRDPDLVLAGLTV